MRKVLVYVAVILAASLFLSGCTDDDLTLVTAPSPEPSATPTPDPVDACTIIQTEIVAEKDGKRLYAWRYYEDIFLRARFVFHGQTTPGFDASACPALTAVSSWLLLPAGLCDQFGSVFTSEILVSCLRPGTLDVTVTPQSINGTTPPQGRGRFDIRP
jgi:hypothetical protein